MTRQPGTVASLVTAALLTAAVGPGRAEPWLDQTRAYGSNTLRYSHYDADGDESSGPYPFLGDFYFNEFNIYLNHDVSEYDRVRAEISGVANMRDAYRSADDGFVPERLNFTRENGEFVVPYRAEYGDYFSYYSNLTLQRSLKGFQVELQPVTGNPDRNYSLVVTAGAQEPSWRDLNLDENFTTGASFLVQDRSLGGLSFNVVHNYRDSADSLGTLDRSQVVASLAGELPFAAVGQEFLFEGEVAYFDGDHDGLATPASGQGTNDPGYFAQLSGRSARRPLDYRVLFEQYGQDFRPQGAIVSFDRRSFEVHSGWRFDSGLRLRGRVQRFEDGIETSNALETHTYGANLSGPILGRYARGVSMRADGFIQTVEDDLGTTDRRTENLDVSVSAPLSPRWTSRTGIFIQNLDDKVMSTVDVYTRQLSLDADRTFQLAGFSGVVTPGILLRTLRRGLNFSDDVFPTLALSARRGPHALRMNYAAQFQDRRFATSGPDIETHLVNADYQFTNRSHVLGVEANLFERGPDPGRDTSAWRLSLYWTWSFDKPPAALAQAPRPGAPGASALGAEGIDILTLPLGSSSATVDAALERAGAGAGTSIAGYRVFEYPVIDRIFQRQRLAVNVQDGLLQRVALVIDFDDIGDRDNVRQTFEEIRQELIRRFGGPTRTFEEGEFGTDFVDAVNAQRLVRIVEWRTSTGTLRFDIPRRLDGQVRMDVQHAPRFPQPRETLWSVEELR